MNMNDHLSVMRPFTQKSMRFRSSVFVCFPSCCFHV